MKTLKPNPLLSLSIVVAIAVFGWILSVGSVRGQTIQNPSFELDNFTGYPGYISVAGNGPITGWTGSPATQVGINPAGGSPFANNGVIPNGTKVAFIQSQNGSPGVLSTVISDLTPDVKYTVNFRLNARTNAYVPFLKIAIDAQPIVSLSVNQVQVGSTAPYKYAAFDFTATAAAHTLYLTNDAAGDHAVLVDDFSINVSTNGWSIAPWNDDTTAGVDSALNFTHAYNFGGNAAPDVTINGVLFKGLVGANPAVANDFFIQGLGSAFTSDDANNITGNSAALSKRFIYGGNPGYFNLAGLVPGMEYVATFYAVGWQDTPSYLRAQTFSYYNDRLTANQDHYGDNNGIRISYRYVAPANGAITLMVSPMLSGNTLHLNGFANHEANPQTTPVIGLQPRSQVSTPGATATFSVTAGGARPLSFQWYNNGTLLTDQTNRFLTVSNLTTADVGPYYVVVSNAHGEITSQGATLTFGQIANPSFEADVFRTWPGYISGNTPISGWTASNPGRAGINPMPDYPGPFVNSGTVPDGTQAGFLQSSGSQWLSTLIDGLTPGENYVLTFRAQARSDQRPTTRVAIDGQQIGEFRSGPMGADGVYPYIAFNFVPAASAAVLHLTNDASGDTTVVLDDFRVAPFTTKWSYAAWNDDGSSGVDATKGYSHAYNFGVAGLAVDTTVNGVRFLGAPGPNPAVSGRFSTANLTGAFTGAESNALMAIPGGSASLAQSFVYFAGTIPAGQAQTITLTNLVPGVEYEASIYGVGFDGAGSAYARSATFAVGDDRLTINEDVFGNDNGIRVSYRYVADASGSLALTYVPTERASSFHTYGFCNAEVASTNAPLVYRAPQGRTVTATANVILDGLVGGQAPLFLQWQKNGVDLLDQTNQVLALANVTGADSGNYTLVVSNAMGVVTSVVATVEVGLAMANPSFEVDAFPTYPGYISGNFPITGWTSTTPASAGLNPAGAQSPFANNGAVPDGAQVAFIQADGGIISQVITGMVVGKTYYLKFYENSRSGYNAPRLAVTLGGETIVPVHFVPSGAYARVVSGPFLATAESAELAFIKTAGAVAGADTTLLLDNVAVLDLPPTPPQFITQPAGTYLKEGDTLSLAASVQGTLPMNYQWQRNEEDIAGATGSALTIPGILMSQAGQYRLVVNNEHGGATSEVAVVRVGLGIAELFNTGVDDYGALLIAPMLDPHYQMSLSADPNYPGPACLVGTNVPASYAANGPNSQWISPDPNTTANIREGTFAFRTSFLLDSLDPATAEIRGQWGVDNLGLDILLNGVSLGLSNNAGFQSLSSFIITNGFVAGSNTLVFVFSNLPPASPMALRVELYGVAMPLPPKAPEIVSHPQNLLAQELGDAVFTVTATGSPVLSYQWYYEGIDLPGQTNRILRLTAVSPFDQPGQYWVVVTNPEGSATSDPAILTVNAAPALGDDQIATGENQSVAVPTWKLLVNDFDPDEDALTLVAVSPTSVGGGTVVLSSNTVVYTPPPNTGFDQFTYQVRDSRGGLAVGNVYILIGLTEFVTVVSPPQILPNGHVHIGYIGIPSYPYSVEWAPAITGPWNTLTNVVADPGGWFEIEDATEPRPPTRFYRTIYP